MRALLSSLAIAAVALPAAAQDVPTVEEPGSHIPFPMWLDAPGSGARQVLMGMGLRERTILKVDVYAFGLYVDSAGAVSQLRERFGGKSHRDLERDDGFYEALLGHDFGMTLRLLMARDVDAETMAEAFDGALRPRVERAAADMNMPGGVAALEQFRGFFSVEEMTDGSELLFACAPDGTLSTKIKGRSEPDISSAALCWALFDVYLGDDPISGNGKKSVIANFVSLLGTSD